MKANSRLNICTVGVSLLIDFSLPVWGDMGRRCFCFWPHARTPQSPIGSATFQRGDWLLLTWPPSLRPTELVTASSPGQICAEAEIVAVQTMPQVCFEVKMMGEAADVIYTLT